MELGSTDDSVWAYFDSQHQYIIDQMNQTYKSALSVIRSNAIPVPILVVIFQDFFLSFFLSC